MVLDGQDYRRRARIANIVDNLIAQGRIRPIALAMPYNGRGARGVEYACSEATLVLLLYDLLELAQKELNLVDIRANPGAHGILGASMEWLTQIAIRLFILIDRYCTLAGGPWQTVCQTGSLQ